MRRCVIISLEVPFDIERQVTLRHVTVELDRFAGEHRLVRFEGYDVWQYC